VNLFILDVTCKEAHRKSPLPDLGSLMQHVHKHNQHKQQHQMVGASPAAVEEPMGEASMMRTARSAVAITLVSRIGAGGRRHGSRRPLPNCRRFGLPQPCCRRSGRPRPIWSTSHGGVHPSDANGVARQSRKRRREGESRMWRCLNGRGRRRSGRTRRWQRRRDRRWR